MAGPTAATAKAAAPVAAAACCAVQLIQHDSQERGRTACAREPLALHSPAAAEGRMDGYSIALGRCTSQDGTRASAGGQSFCTAPAQQPAIAGAAPAHVSTVAFRHPAQPVPLTINLHAPHFQPAVLHINPTCGISVRRPLPSYLCTASDLHSNQFPTYLITCTTVLV